MEKADWIWMPHPAHFCASSDCKFHLATMVGDYIVSTVGEYLPDSRVRQIFAESRGIEIVGRGDDWDRDYMAKIGYEEIGYHRKYETMVFRSRPADDLCCPFRIASGTEVGFEGYNSDGAATEGHYRFCEEWSRIEAMEPLPKE